MRVYHEALTPAQIVTLNGSTKRHLLQTEHVGYSYDVYDRRIGKTYGPTVGPPQVEYFVYGVGVNEYSEILLSFDGTMPDDLTNRYLHGPEVDQVLADEQYVNSLKPSTDTVEVLWALTDNLGTVRDIVSHDSGTTTVENHLDYNSFGQIIAESNADTKYIFSYIGRERDYETGDELMHLRGRFINVAIASFISEDPIRDDYNNLYRYSSNDPINRKDPSGLEEAKINAPDLDKLTKGTSVTDAFSFMPSHSQSRRSLLSSSNIAATANNFNQPPKISNVTWADWQFKLKFPSQPEFWFKANVSERDAVTLLNLAWDYETLKWQQQRYESAYDNIRNPSGLKWFLKNAGNAGSTGGGNPSGYIEGPSKDEIKMRKALDKVYSLQSEYRAAYDRIVGKYKNDLKIDKQVRPDYSVGTFGVQGIGLPDDKTEWKWQKFRFSGRSDVHPLWDLSKELTYHYDNKLWGSYFLSSDHSIKNVSMEIFEIAGVAGIAKGLIFRSVRSIGVRAFSSRALASSSDDLLLLSTKRGTYSDLLQSGRYLKQQGFNAITRREILSSFERGTIRFGTTTTDEAAFRFFSRSSRARGQYLTSEFTTNPIRQLALPPGNSGIFYEQFIIPKNTTIIRGTVGPNFGFPGRGSQIFLSKPGVLHPIPLIGGP